jgi:hypothetical protein
LDSAGEPLGMGSFGAQEGQRQVQALDLAEPAFVCGSLPAVEQVGLDLVQACQHSRLDLQDGAAKARMLMLTRRAVGTPAGAQLDLALIEMLFELGPFLSVGCRYSPGGRVARRRSRVGLVVTDDVVVEDGHIAAGGLQGQVTEQRCADMDGQPPWTSSVANSLRKSWGAKVKSANSGLVLANSAGIGELARHETCSLSHPVLRTDHA